MFEKLIEQPQRFTFMKPDNLFDPDRIDVDRLAAGLRMDADQWMRHRARLDLLLVTWKLWKFPLAVFALIDVTRLQPVDPFFHVIRQPVVSLVHVDELGV